MRIEELGRQKVGEPIGCIAPDHPIDGNIWSESRNMTWNPLDDIFIIAHNDGNIGTWDPTDVSANAADLVAANAINHKDVAWYQSDAVGGENRLFSGVNDTSPGDAFYELGTDSGDFLNFLQPVGDPVVINVNGGPGGAVTQRLD
jgi:hypothetical protein